MFGIVFGIEFDIVFGPASLRVWPCVWPCVWLCVLFGPVFIPVFGPMFGVVFRSVFRVLFRVLFGHVFGPVFGAVFGAVFDLQPVCLRFSCLSWTVRLTAALATSGPCSARGSSRRLYVSPPGGHKLRSHSRWRLGRRICLAIGPPWELTQIVVLLICSRCYFYSDYVQYAYIMKTVMR